MDLTQNDKLNIIYGGRTIPAAAVEKEGNAIAFINDKKAYIEQINANDVDNVVDNKGNTTAINGDVDLLFNTIVNSFFFSIGAAAYSLTDDTFLENRVKVTQENYTTTLLSIDSSKEYFIDGIVDISANPIEIVVPPSGIEFKGYSFDTSKLVCSADNYTLFKSNGGVSGNVLFTDLAFEVSGNSSKVYDLIAGTGTEAIECNRVNYDNCTSLGEINGYRQGLELGTGRFGGTPSLCLSGAWSGGFRISTSIARSIDDNMTEPLFKAGTGFSMNSRFLTDLNVNLGNTAALADFSPVNFGGSNRLEIINAFIARNGVFDPSDATILPNISEKDLQSNWRNNVGINNTFQGGLKRVSTESTTTVSVQGDFYDINGTFTAEDLDHVDAPSNGQLRYLADTNKSFKLTGQFLIEGTANNELALRVAIFRDASTTFDFLTPIIRQVNSLVGGRDTAIFNFDYVFTLNENDYIKLQGANNSGTGNFTAELDSFYRLEER